LTNQNTTVIISPLKHALSKVTFTINLEMIVDNLAFLQGWALTAEAGYEVVI
jgi:hypothetical protein